eukprot:CAMPEP_0202510152 /NCGR_PEP_ID=MMETSP1361-20130828/53146_1 /ASSEMBLY_ACC=CAM_ASM_000849 /TAXON_ID=210615 /ORGANISM="Staurosira complex sp., Strain CCMP2646" /LENGTH=424 /DNA_ID=CAMNT_0049144405 /DNA_START=29 /DNA_END=1303 /DNA_ORIENTATION=+
MVLKETADLEEELDRLELEAALSAACHSADSAEISMTFPSDGDVKEVSYNETGGTPLFKQLEQCEWNNAFELCNEESLQTWVKSTGTTNTTFGWAIWRRLPIHEAVRRQAPAWLLVKMLSLYPESAWQTTQFGELPLHLAVETGSTPEVLHLLLIAYMEGTSRQDNSGRTPLDLVKENEYPDPIILESLGRATTNHLRLLQNYQDKIQQIEANHAEQMKQTLEQHEREIQGERETQARLQQELKEATEFAASMKKLGENSKQVADDKTLETRKWKATVDELKDEIKQRQEEKEVQQQTEQDLRTELANRDATIQELLERIDTLSADLSNSLVFHRDTVIKSMDKANEDLQYMLKTQQALQGHLTGQVKGLEMLLEKRGIEIPPLPPVRKTETPPPEVDTSEAIHAASKAANKALEVSNAKQGYV